MITIIVDYPLRGDDARRPADDVIDNGRVALSGIAVCSPGALRSAIAYSISRRPGMKLSRRHSSKMKKEEHRPFLRTKSMIDVVEIIELAVRSSGE